MSNALKFTHSGGVSVSFDLETTLNTNQAALIIRVKDTGIGIEPEKLDAVFEPFVQAEETTTREYGGTGLGLAIVKNLLDMLEGDIRVRSAKDAGSEFVIDIPVTYRTQPMSGPMLDESIAPRDLFEKSLKVLLVEDNHTNAFIAQALSLIHI